MTKLTRRRFLKNNTLTLAAAGVASSVGVHASHAVEAKSSPSEVLRVAVVGCGGRGNAHIDGFSSSSGSKIVAFCDADRTHLDQAADKFDKKQNTKLKRFVDYRKVLEDDQIDVIAIATPNHWHALMTIQACQAGKHVYTEKPVCHNVWEGRKMIEAMRKYDRIVGAGFQNRSDIGLRAAFPWIQAGNLGSITSVRGLCNRNRNSIGITSAPIKPPSELDYDLWLGPAADLPIYRPNLHYDWHWDWNTGNGDMGNQGPHEMDLVQWVLGDPGHPKSVRSIGGRFAWNDGGNTPNMQVASFDFGNGIPVTFEVRNIHNKQNVGQFADGPGVGVVVTCEDGEFRGGRGGGSAFDKSGKRIKKFDGDAGATHMSNYIDAVLAGDASMLRSPLEAAFHSSCMSHLANISVRTGADSDATDVLSRAGNDATIAEVIERFSVQLNDLDIDFEKTPWHVGAPMTFDPANERFVSGEKMDQANRLLKRDCRSPFIVPEQV